VPDVEEDIRGTQGRARGPRSSATRRWATATCRPATTSAQVHAPREDGRADEGPDKARASPRPTPPTSPPCPIPCRRSCRSAPSRPTEVLAELHALLAPGPQGPGRRRVRAVPRLRLSRPPSLPSPHLPSPPRVEIGADPGPPEPPRGGRGHRAAAIPLRTSRPPIPPRHPLQDPPMKIKLLQAVGEHAKGATITVDDAVGEKYVAAGLAEAVADEAERGRRRHRRGRSRTPSPQGFAAGLAEVGAKAPRPPAPGAVPDRRRRAGGRPDQVFADFVKQVVIVGCPNLYPGGQQAAANERLVKVYGSRLNTWEQEGPGRGLGRDRRLHRRPDLRHRAAEARRRGVDRPPVRQRQDAAGARGVLPDAQPDVHGAVGGPPPTTAA
jgi:hypothetical protein